MTLPVDVVLQGDALATLRTLPDASIDAIVTDPPYGMDLQPQRRKTKAIKNDTRREAKSLWWSFVPELYRVAKPDTAHLICGRWSEAWAQEVLAEWFTVKGCIVWRKNQWGIGYYLRPQWELLWYCHKGAPSVPEKAESDVWECARESAPEHSCQKPIELMRRAVRYVTPPGGVVLDPFAGSGSTLVAAKMDGFRYLGIESEAEYVRLAERRLGEIVPAWPSNVTPLRPRAQRSLWEAIA